MNRPMNECLTPIVKRRSIKLKNRIQFRDSVMLIDGRQKGVNAPTITVFSKSKYFFQALSALLSFALNNRTEFLLAKTSRKKFTLTL